MGPVGKPQAQGTTKYAIITTQKHGARGKNRPLEQRIETLENLLALSNRFEELERNFAARASQPPGRNGFQGALAIQGRKFAHCCISIAAGDKPDYGRLFCPSETAPRAAAWSIRSSSKNWARSRPRTLTIAALMRGISSFFASLRRLGRVIFFV